MAERTIKTKDTTSDDIERDIVKTRAELSHTLDEIGERFSARHWKGLAQETIREKVDSAKSRGRDLSGKVRESARSFMDMAGERSAKARDQMPRFMREHQAAARVIAFELGAWIVIALKGLASRRREKKRNILGGNEYAKAKIMSMEEVEQKVKKAALAPEEGAQKAA